MNFLSIFLDSLFTVQELCHNSQFQDEWNKKLSWLKFTIVWSDSILQYEQFKQNITSWYDAVYVQVIGNYFQNKALNLK